MKILVTNDDGYLSPHFHILADQLHCSGHKVFVVVPATEQSGVGQAITYHNAIRCRQVQLLPYPMTIVRGTPSDCVKFAITHLYRSQKFDLAISGINPGENAGISTLYSGTVAAAREAAVWGLSSMAISVYTGKEPYVQFAAKWLTRLLEQPLFSEQPIFWNINFPACEPGKIAGVRVCEMGASMFSDFYSHNTTPRGMEEYWLEGKKEPEKFLPASDDAAINNNCIAITPLQIQQTDFTEIRRLKNLSMYLSNLHNIKSSQH